MATHRRRWIASSWFLLVLIASMAAVYYWGHPERLRSTPGVTERIDPTELPAVISRAEKGDIPSIKRLVNHYLFDEENDDAGFRWARKGAALGDESLRMLVLANLLRSTSPTRSAEAAALAREWGISLERLQAAASSPAGPGSASQFR